MFISGQNWKEDGPYKFVMSRFIAFGLKNVSDKECKGNQNAFHLEFDSSKNRDLYEMIPKSTQNARNPSK